MTFCEYLNTLVAHQLALRFGGDPGSCDWRHFGRLAGFTNQKKKRRLVNGLHPFVRLRRYDGRVYPAVEVFLHEVETLRREILSQRESRKGAKARWTNTSVRPLTSFHDDPRYGNDLHRADMAWSLHAADHSLSREQIEHEILNGRDLTKKGSAPRRLAYAMRTVTKAIGLFGQ